MVAAMRTALVLCALVAVCTASDVRAQFAPQPQRRPAFSPRFVDVAERARRESAPPAEAPSSPQEGANLYSSPRMDYAHFMFRDRLRRELRRNNLLWKYAPDVAAANGRLLTTAGLPPPDIFTNPQSNNPQLDPGSVLMPLPFAAGVGAADMINIRRYGTPAVAAALGAGGAAPFARLDSDPFDPVYAPGGARFGSPLRALTRTPLNPLVDATRLPFADPQAGFFGPEPVNTDLVPLATIAAANERANIAPIGPVPVFSAPPPDRVSSSSIDQMIPEVIALVPNA